MQKLPLILCFLAAPALAKPTPKGPAVGAGKPPPACGVKVLPLQLGNSWTYQNLSAPTPPDEKLAKISPTPIRQVVIVVTNVAVNNPDTVVTLEETLTVDIRIPAQNGRPESLKSDERKLTSTIVCNAKNKFEISPESFFFAGEPGGYLNMTIDKVERPKGSWVLTNGTFGENEFREDVIATWSRKPTPKTSAKPSSGKLELERKFTPQTSEAVITKAGSWPKTEKLGLVTTGRISVDNAHPDNKPMELPAGWTTQFWMVEGLGVVQVINGYSHMYQLVESK